VPRPELTATEVVEVQLRALQENDPMTDDGLAKTFEFASPGNRAATGPIRRFASMIRNGYPILLNSSSFSVLSALRVGEGRYAVRVRVVAGDSFGLGGEEEVFFWQLSKTESCWMTDAVMPEAQSSDEDTAAAAEI